MVKLKEPSVLVKFETNRRSRKISKQLTRIHGWILRPRKPIIKPSKSILKKEAEEVLTEDSQPTSEDRTRAPPPPTKLKPAVLKVEERRKTPKPEFQVAWCQLAV